MSDEIEEFIRRAAERRKQAQGARRPAQQPRPVAPPLPPGAKLRPPPAAPAQPWTVPAEVVPAEIVEDVAERTLGQSRQFAERASHFGEQPGLADDRMDAHIQHKFDHQLGRLEQRAVTQVQHPVLPGTEAPAPAHEALAALVRMLRSPQSLRQAIILSEILKRPERF